MKYNQLVDLLPLSEEGKMVLRLDNMYLLMEALGNPQDSIPMIHIAGTNGKGSTASFVSHMLQEAGYKVGLFSSPSLIEFNERIQVNGQFITDEELLTYARRIQQAVADSELEMTEFELFTTLAFMHFEQECDIAIMEVGLGGALDATNVIASPAVTAITKIGLDHTAILGDTLEEIAGEKAGIIKPNTPVVVYPQNHAGVDEVILNRASEQDAPVTYIDMNALSYELSSDRTQDFQYKNVLYQINLLEEHQIKNAVVALEIIFTLQKSDWALDSNAIDQGLYKTVWPARFELISDAPTVIIDGSHNEDGLQAFKANLNRYFKTERKIGVIGFMRDKQVDEALANVIADFDVMITVTPDTPRALSAEELKDKIIELNTSHPNQEVFTSQSLDDALDQAVSLAMPEDVIAIFGSFYFVGFMRQMILAGRNEEI